MGNPFSRKRFQVSERIDPAFRSIYYTINPYKEEKVHELPQSGSGSRSLFPCQQKRTVPYNPTWLPAFTTSTLLWVEASTSRLKASGSWAMMGQVL